jgi:uncharacterized membrane protein
MESQRFCQDCIQKHDCKRIYEQLGDSSCKSVTLKVIFAFLLPLIVFIVSLAVFERVLVGTTNIEGLHITLSFVLALIVTFIYVYIIRVFNKQLGLNK